MSPDTSPVLMKTLGLAPISGSIPAEANEQGQGT